MPELKTNIASDDPMAHLVPAAVQLWFDIVLDLEIVLGDKAVIAAKALAEVDEAKAELTRAQVHLQHLIAMQGDD